MAAPGNNYMHLLLWEYWT